MQEEHKGAVLVVDDTPANLGVLFAQLEHANFRVLIAEDGTSALRSVERIKPDIILLDVRLPDIDGFELCRRLQSKPEMADIPIIFLSVLVDTADKLKGLGLHAVDYITKPFEAAEVVARVEKHLIVHNLQKRLSKQNARLQQEIAERKRAEQQIRQQNKFLNNVIESLHHPFMVIDVNNYDLVKANSSARTFGDDTMKSCYALIHNRRCPCDLCPLEEIKQSKKPIVVEHIHFDQDGHARNVEVHAFPITNNDGEVVQIIEYTMDITKRKQAEQELQQQKIAAEAANRAKSTFLANMSHELRTPLNVILGFTQLMGRNRNLTAQQKEQLSTISRSGEHLLGLINDILELSKIEAGQSVLQAESVDLYRMLTALDKMFRLRTEAKGLALIFSQAGDVPQHVRMDGGKVRQVLINLLSNAVKFTQEGHVRVRVSGKSTSTARPTNLWLEFEVSDSGVGIAADELDAVFEAFVQTSSGQKSQQGTGLGMSISRAFVEMMGGSLTLTSEVAVGTTCRFDIPVERITRPRKRTRQVMGLQPNQYAPDGGPYRLLVAEDQAANRQLLVKLLSSLGKPPQGVEVREALNGKEAIQIWRQWQPHLIWMDMRMPVMDGLEATRQIKATPQGKETVIVALTALAFWEDEERMLAEGCDDYVRKPFHQEDIFSVLAKHLNLAFIYDSTDELNELDELDELDKIKATPHQAQQTKERDITSLLATMPAQWLDDLREEAFIGDLSGMTALVAQIRQMRRPNHPNDKYLADKLTELINSFKWDEILMLIPKAAKT